MDHESEKEGFQISIVISFALAPTSTVTGNTAFQGTASRIGSNLNVPISG